MTEPELPVRNFQRLKTVFCSFDDDRVREMCKSLRDEGVEIPVWCDEECSLCVRLPAAFADRVVAADWSKFVLPDPDLQQVFYAGTRQKARLVGWKHCPGLQGEFPAARFHNGPDDRAETEKFTVQSANNALQIVRNLAGRLNLQDPGDQELWQDCRNTALLLQRFEDDLEPASLHQGIVQMRGRVNSDKLPFQSEFLLKCMLLSYHLRDCGSLRAVLTRAVDMVVPSMFRSSLLEMLQNHGRSRLKLPDKSKLSRARLTVDVAYMLHQRQLNSASLQQPGTFVRFIMADSSVQGHHDFLLIRTTKLDMSKAANMFQSARELLSLWRECAEHAESGTDFADMAEYASKEERDFF